MLGDIELLKRGKCVCGHYDHNGELADGACYVDKNCLCIGFIPAAPTDSPQKAKKEKKMPTKAEEKETPNADNSPAKTFDLSKMSRLWPENNDAPNSDYGIFSCPIEADRYFAVQRSSQHGDRIVGVYAEEWLLFDEYKEELGEKYSRNLDAFLPAQEALLKLSEISQRSQPNCFHLTAKIESRSKATCPKCGSISAPLVVANLAEALLAANEVLWKEKS